MTVERQGIVNLVTPRGDKRVASLRSVNKLSSKDMMRRDTLISWRLLSGYDISSELLVEDSRI